MLPESLFGPLRRCVELLYQSEILLPFTFVYDEFWICLPGGCTFLSAVLGRTTARLDLDLARPRAGHRSGLGATP